MTEVKAGLLTDRSRMVYLTILCLLIVCSFLFFSEYYSPYFNSDCALEVLQAISYHLPADLYCWGQDRGGTIVPLLASSLLKIVNVHPVIAVSIARYLILITGFYFLTKQVQSRFLQVAFGVLWFMPQFYSIELIVDSFSLMYSFLFISYYLINKYNETKNRTVAKRIFYLSLIDFFLLLSLWTLDLAIVNIAILIAMSLFRNFKKSTSKKFYLSILPDAIIHCVWILIATAFVLYAKHFATDNAQGNLYVLNNFDQITVSLQNIFLGLQSIFLFHSDNAIVSILFYFVLIGGVVLLIRKRAQKSDRAQDKFWMYYHLFCCIGFFLLIVFSYWSYLNGVGRRYFSLVYICLVLTYIMYLDKSALYKNSIHTAFLTCILILSITSNFYKYVYPERRIPMMSKLKVFENMKDIGIIGGYWHSYVIACYNPTQIKATPAESYACRNADYADETFKQSKLYLIKNDWLDTFPDSINVYNRELYKCGQEFKLGEWELCNYQLQE